MYKDWRGPVYPPRLPQREWFAHYATLFDTVELNTTFYRLPTVEAVERWAAQAPAGFTYALKLGAFGSHRMKLRDAARWLPNHLDRVAGSVPSLGPTLVQLPPGWKRDVARLDEFLAAAATSRPTAVGGRAARAVVGARRRVRDARAPRRRALHPRPAPRPPVGAHDRLDLPALPRSPRARAEVPRPRTPAAVSGGSPTASSAWLDEGTDVYAYFNNDYDGHAVADATWLAGRLPEPGHVTATSPLVIRSARDIS